MIAAHLVTNIISLTTDIMNPNKKVQLVAQPEPGKDSRTNSEMESLLVSSVRYEPTIYYSSETQGDSRPLRASQKGSIIKRNIHSNIVIEDTHRCNCEYKLETVVNSIQVLSLTLEELQTKISLCFNKQATIQSQLATLFSHKEQENQKQWELGVKWEQQASRNARNREEVRLELGNLQEEMVRVKKIIGKLESKDNEKCLPSKLLEHRFEKYKGEQESRMSLLLQSIDEMRNLQKKIISSFQKEPLTFPDEESSVLPYSIDPPGRMKVMRGCSMGRKRTCQSTNISYSRNTDN